MKAVTDRTKSYLAILTASRRWSRSTARPLAELLRPELAAGEELPDLVLLQELFARALARRWRRVQAADEARVAARRRRRALLAELDRRIRALYREVADLRSVLAGVFDAATVRRVIVFTGDTSRDPLVLLRQAARLVARLRDLFESTDDPRVRWAAPLKAAARTLEATFAAASLARKELEAAQAELRQALAEFNPLFVGVAGWLTATYQAAGHEQRAAAVRPSRRRRGLLLQHASRSRPPVAAAPGLLLQDAGRAGRTPAAAAAASAGNRPERRVAVGGASGAVAGVGRPGPGARRGGARG